MIKSEIWIYKDSIRWKNNDINQDSDWGSEGILELNAVNEILYVNGIVKFIFTHRALWLDATYIGHIYDCIVNSNVIENDYVPTDNQDLFNKMVLLRNKISNQ